MMARKWDCTGLDDTHRCISPSARCALHLLCRPGHPRRITTESLRTMADDCAVCMCSSNVLQHTLYGILAMKYSQKLEITSEEGWLP